MGKRVREGSYFPQGATPAEGGVNFALFSRYAEGVDLLFFDRPQDSTPAEIIHINNRDRFMWHCFVEGAVPGQLYAYRSRALTSRKTASLQPNRLLIALTPGLLQASLSGTYHLGYDPPSPLADFSFNELNNAGMAPKCIVMMTGLTGKDARAVPLRETLYRGPPERINSACIVGRETSRRLPGSH
jgi:glycogen operon protein